MIAKIRRALGLARGVAVTRSLSRVVVGSKVTIVRRDGGRLEIGSGSVLESYGQISVRGRLVIGQNVRIGDHVHINAITTIEIGDGSEISWAVQLMDTDFHWITETDGSRGPRDAPITIGRGVLIGARAVVLKGVSIGDGAVVAAGSIVTKDVLPRWVVAGVPAKHVREIGSWE